MKFFRGMAVAGAALLLQSCFFAPGKFTSQLEVRRGGQFTFSYTGEVLFAESFGSGGDTGEIQCFGPVPRGEGAAKKPASYQAPPAPPPVIMTAPSPADRKPPPMPEIDFGERACTPAERAERIARRERQRQEQAVAAGAAYGFNPLDPASIQRFTAELQKYRGWRSIVHKGGNRFEVDYRISGTLSQDYVFPVFDRAIVHTPFVILRPRTDGSVEVRAPAFGGGGSFAALAGLGGPFRAANPEGQGLNELLKRTDGTFTIATDGEIRANNTAEGPSARGADKLLSWRVAGLTQQEAPRALIAF